MEDAKTGEREGKRQGTKVGPVREERPTQIPPSPEGLVEEGRDPEGPGEVGWKPIICGV